MIQKYLSCRADAEVIHVTAALLDRFLSHRLQKEKASSFGLWESTAYTDACYRGSKSCCGWWRPQFAGSGCEAAVGMGPVRRVLELRASGQCPAGSGVENVASGSVTAGAQGQKWSSVSLRRQCQGPETGVGSQSQRRCRRREAKKKSCGDCAQRLLELYRVGLVITWD